jgi:hypothetical protein
MGSGAHVTAGGVWTNASSRDKKENLQAVAPHEVLDTLASLPLYRWNYKNEDSSVRHLGPVAEDFATAFALGGSDKHIGTIDADGVALAAIQGLHQIVTEKDGAIAELEAENARIQARLERIEALMGELSTRTLDGGN